MGVKFEMRVCPLAVHTAQYAPVSVASNKKSQCRANGVPSTSTDTRLMVCASLSREVVYYAQEPQSSSLDVKCGRVARNSCMIDQVSHPPGSADQQKIWSTPLSVLKVSMDLLDSE